MSEELGWCFWRGGKHVCRISQHISESKRQIFCLYLPSTVKHCRSIVLVPGSPVVLASIEIYAVRKCSYTRILILCLQFTVQSRDRQTNSSTLVLCNRATGLRKTCVTDTQQLSVNLMCAPCEKMQCQCWMNALKTWLTFFFRSLMVGWLIWWIEWVINYP